jgi:hypothetical protein
MDDDDKVRRNLMVVSFAVLVYFWLDLPDSMVLKRLLGSESAPSVAGWKVWALILAVVGYQFHRYWSVLIGTAQWQSLHGQIVSRRYNLMVWLSGFNVKRLPAKKRLWFASVDKPAKLGGEPKGYARSPDEAPMLHDTDYPWSNHPYLMEVKLTVEDKEGRISTGKSSIWVELPRWLQWPEMGLCTLSLINTRYLSEVGIPVVIGSVAFIAVLCKFVSLLV